MDILSDLEQLITDCQYGDFDLRELTERVEQAILDENIIYYTSAIKFLSEHDCSLRESLALASDYGYEISDLTSEVLATLLYQTMLFEALASVDLNDYLEDTDNG